MIIWLGLIAIASALGGVCGWFDPTDYVGNLPDAAAAIIGGVTSGGVVGIFFWVNDDSEERARFCGLLALLLGGVFGGMVFFGAGSLADAACTADIGFVGGIAVVLAPIGALVGLIVGVLFLGVFWVYIAPRSTPPVSGDDLPYGGWVTSILILGIDVILFALVWGKHFWGRTRR